MKKKLQFEKLLPNVFSAVILNIFSVTSAISLAALIFSGELAEYLPTGVGILLIEKNSSELCSGESQFPGISLL